MKKNIFAVIVTVVLFLALAGQAFPSEANATVQADAQASHHQALVSGESSAIEIANLSCQELSALGSAVNTVLDRETKLDNIRKIAAIRAQDLASEAQYVGGLFKGPVGFFRRIFSDWGWIEVEPPENVVTLSIDAECVSLGLSVTATDLATMFFGPLGGAVTGTLSELAKWAGTEIGTKAVLQDIGYAEVKSNVGIMTIIYDKEAEVAWVNIDLEDLEDEWKESYGWQNEHIYMYVPFDGEPPNLKKTDGTYDYEVVFKGEAVELPLLTVPFFSQRDGKWSTDKLGIQGPSIYSSGCALTSAAMVMAYYGVDTDPGRLNELIGEEGYTDDYLLKWQVVAEQCSTEQADVEFVTLINGDWQDLEQRLDEELGQKYPVIAWVKSSNISSHFIVFRGKIGDEYHFFDPADESLTDQIWPEGHHGKYELQGVRIYHGSFAPSSDTPKPALSHPWPMSAQNAQKTCCSPYMGPESPNTRLLVEFDEPGLSGCLVSADGTVYINRQNADAMSIIAIKLNGSHKEIVQSQGVGGLGAIGPRGTLYIMLWEENKGAILALDAEGTELWRRSLPLCPDNLTWPKNILIGADGTIYAWVRGNEASSLTVFSPDGTELWSLLGAYSGLAIAEYGTVYSVMEEGKVCAYDGQGEKKWEYDGRNDWSGYYDRVNYSIAIGQDGTVFILPNMLGIQDASAGRLIALTPTLKKAWHVDIPVDINSEFEAVYGPAIAPDGSLYILEGNNLFKISPDGKLELFAKGDFCPKGPIVDAAGVVYIAESTYTNEEQPKDTSKVIAIAPDGSEKWCTSLRDFGIWLDAVGADGNFFIWPDAIGADGTIYGRGEYWVEGQGVFQPILAIEEASSST